MAYTDNVTELQELNMYRLSFATYEELLNSDQLDPNAFYFVTGDEVQFDTVLNAISENAPQTKVVFEALQGKVDKVTGKGLSTNDYTTNEKNKLAGITAEANKTVVDSALSTTSTNPVENKAVKAALDLKADTSDVPKLYMHTWIKE